MKCSSCDKDRSELKPRKSLLLPGVPLLMCQSCINSKFEPRWVVILSARRYGKEAVGKYIRDHQYAGKPILAEEIVV